VLLDKHSYSRQLLDCSLKDDESLYCVVHYLHYETKLQSDAFEFDKWFMATITILRSVSLELHRNGRIVKLRGHSCKYA
jgi:hypothetical protein